MLGKPLSWWYWPAIVLLLSASLFGLGAALPWAIGLAAVQLLDFLVRSRGSMSFPVQVRASYLALLILGAWPPLAFVHWIQFVGTWTMVITDYCFLARCLSLLPWNRQARLSRTELLRTFFSPPRAGSFLDRPRRSGASTASARSPGVSRIRDETPS